MKGKLLLLAALALGGCHDDDSYDPTVPTDMELLSGSGQVADAGTEVLEPLSVVVLNLEGDPVEGIEVEWFIMTGGGSVSDATTVTDADGIASVTFRLGSQVGEQRVQAVNAGLSGSPVVFTGTARAGSGGGGGPGPN
jgi:hypothetical protein